MKRLLCAVLLTGCASAPVAVADGEVTRVGHEAALCVAGAPPREAQRVRVIRRECRQLTPKITIVHCAPEPLDEGVIVRVVDAHCAVVRLDHDAALRAGDQLELATR